MNMRIVEAMKIPTTSLVTPITMPEFTIPTMPDVPTIDMSMFPNEAILTPPPIDMSGAFDNSIPTPTPIDMPETLNNPVASYTPDFSALDNEVVGVSPPPGVMSEFSNMSNDAAVIPSTPDFSVISNNPASSYTPDLSNMENRSYISIMPVEYVPLPDTTAWIPDFTELNELMRRARAEAAERQRKIEADIAAARKRMADAMAENKRQMEAIRQIEADARSRMDKAIADMRTQRLAIKIMNKAAIEKMNAGQAATVNIQLHNLSAEPIDAKVKMSALDNLTDLFTAHMNPGETVMVPHTVNLSDKMRFSVSEIMGE